MDLSYTLLPQAAGLIERMNGLLKQQLRKLGHGSLKGWHNHLSTALNVLRKWQPPPMSL